MRHRLIIVCVLLLTAGLFMQFHKDDSYPLTRPLDSFPVASGQWRTVASQHFDQSTIEVLNPTDYLFRRYINPQGRFVDLYIGYHDGGQGAGPVHSPKNCLPGGGWNLESRQNIKINVGGDALPVVRSLYMKGGVKVQLMYWYQVAGNVFDSELGMKAGEITASVFHRRRDTALVRVSAAVKEGESGNEELLVDFLTAFHRDIKEFLPEKSS